jgi:hypothetical protein
MKRFAKCVTFVLGALVAIQHAGCASDVLSPSVLPLSETVSHQFGLESVRATGAYDFCAAYPIGSAGCALCGHEDLSLEADQERVTIVDLSQCSGDVSFGHFSVVEYIKGGREVQSLDLRPGGGEYELNVRNATTRDALPAAVVVNPTYTYFANVPDPVVLELTVRRGAGSKGGKKSLAVVFSSWLY